MTLSSASRAGLPLPPSLDEAYELCRQETARWAKTFYLGTLLLPPAKRRAIWAIYVWCRRTDELMDSPQAQGLPAEVLVARLDAWESKSRQMYQGQVSDALDLAMVDMFQQFPQSLQPYLDMIEGQRMDVCCQRYATFAELELYC